MGLFDRVFDDMCGTWPSLTHRKVLGRSCKMGFGDVRLLILVRIEDIEGWCWSLGVLRQWKIGLRFGGTRSSGDGR